MNKFSLSIRSTIFRIILSNTREQFFVRCQQTKRWKSYLGIIRTYYNQIICNYYCCFEQIITSNNFIRNLDYYKFSPSLQSLSCPFLFSFKYNNKFVDSKLQGNVQNSFEFSLGQFGQPITIKMAALNTVPSEFDVINERTGKWRSWHKLRVSVYELRVITVSFSRWNAYTGINSRGGNGNIASDLLRSYPAGMLRLLGQRRLGRGIMPNNGAII